MNSARLFIVDAAFAASLAVGASAAETQGALACGPCFELKATGHTFDGQALDGYQWVRVPGVPDARCAAW
jgi:hypothetical protein